MAEISKGINHDSTIVGDNVEFIFEKMPTSTDLTSTLYLLN
jgi:hypothetical protein